MQIFYSVLAGAVQGLSEFLPISSSGHLVLFHSWVNFNFLDDVAFDVMLHLGTLTALLVFFWTDVVKYVTAFCQSLVRWDVPHNKEQLLAWYLFVATMPAAIAGFLFEKTIESYFRTPVSVALMLVLFGLVLYAADHLSQKVNTINQLNWNGAIIIGLAQMLALIPGVSRSGITIIAGLSQKLQREQAARFSFLLSMPIIFGAGVKELPTVFQASSDQYAVLAAGLVSSAVIGYLVIRYFLKYIQGHSLKIFAYYRVALGGLIIIYTLVNR